jgi:PAS domain S-box-containing protein
VYVPVTEDTPPNPKLAHIPERDITTPSGRVLTLINPAYMVRQLMEDFAEAYGIKGKITSKEPLWQGNSPDAWERRALNAFEKGGDEIYEFMEMGGVPHLRLMRPLITKEGCLKCHGFQGYEVGDVRGGINVSVPLGGLMAIEKKAILTLIASHALFWLAGTAGIVFAGTRIRGHFSERMKAEEKYRAIYSQAWDGIVLISPDTGRIVDCNASFEELCGKPLNELREMKIWEIRPREKQEAAKKKFHEVVRDMEGSSSELEFEQPDGTIIPIEFVSKVIEIGRERYIQSISRDITERKRSIEKIEQSLMEKEVLLKEVHHRVKNNLQVIMSLLQLQSKSIDDEEITRLFTESKNRVRSMALVHEKLYQSEDFTRIDVEDYLRSLVSDIMASYDASTDRIGFHFETGGASIDLDSLIPCGLIINELASNSIKHAFAGDRRGKINISLKALGEGELELRVSDDGTGLPEGFDAKNASSLGMLIVNALARQLDGVLEIKSPPGTDIRVKFPVKAS